MAITEKDITICGHGSGTPRTTNLYTYNTNRYSQKADNGVRKGVICVKRLISLTDAKRKEYHDTYKTILGRNIYDQGLRMYCYKLYQKTGRYYSDCSSSICLTFAKIGYGVPALNTAGIYNSELFETVPVNIVNGHITNPEILKVGDCLLYVGNDPSRPKQIGHVESIYEIAGQTGQTSFSYKALKVEATGAKGLVCMVKELNVRALPTTSSKVVGTMTSGQSCKPTEYTEINGVGWFNTGAGWVSGKYLYGWIQVDGGKWKYLKAVEAYAYYSKTVVKIDNAYYAFGEKYMITSGDISSSGAINNQLFV